MDSVLKVNMSLRTCQKINLHSFQVGILGHNSSHRSHSVTCWLKYCKWRSCWEWGNVDPSSFLIKASETAGETFWGGGESRDISCVRGNSWCAMFYTFKHRNSETTLQQVANWINMFLTVFYVTFWRIYKGMVQEKWSKMRTIWIMWVRLWNIIKGTCLLVDPTMHDIPNILFNLSPEIWQGRDATS